MEILIIIKKQLMQTSSMQMQNSPPSSSGIAAKTKSFYAIGIFSGVPSNRPMPNQPPAPTPKSDCATW